ncbi:MAG: amidotransferase [Syntrophobacteraceae bacterium CG07_land_8_20_14_0_80_61_8]|nr:MAG: amidotransferase [Syntrophobacteraceae bacterium CG07_land_8_20_14_0_80_61_8]
MLRLLCLQHVEFEGPAGITRWAEARGHRLETLEVHRQPQWPGADACDWLIVMGGPMNIYQEDLYPWLGPEKAFIRRVITEGKTVLGICLGAQLIADALGSRVFAGAHKEIGWFPVELTEAGKKSRLFGFLPPSFTAFHWHGDTFEIPADCVHLARSEACVAQAFVYRQRVMGLQFHLESTAESVPQLLAHCGDEIHAAPYIQNPDQILAAMPERLPEVQSLLFSILDRLELIDTEE